MSNILPSFLDIRSMGKPWIIFGSVHFAQVNASFLVLKDLFVGGNPMNLISAVYECSPLFKIFFTILVIPVRCKPHQKKVYTQSDLDRNMR